MLLLYNSPDFLTRNWVTTLIYEPTLVAKAMATSYGHTILLPRFDVTTQYCDITFLCILGLVFFVFLPHDRWHTSRDLLCDHPSLKFVCLSCRLIWLRLFYQSPALCWILAFWGGVGKSSTLRMLSDYSGVTWIVELPDNDNDGGW